MSKEILTGDDEKAKAKTRNVLAYVLDQFLRLLHPVMPFVTEKFGYQCLTRSDSLVTAKYPVVNENFVDDKAESDMNHLIELIKAVRNIRAEANAPLGSPVDIWLKLIILNLKMFLKLTVNTLIVLVIQASLKLVRMLKFLIYQ